MPASKPDIHHAINKWAARVVPLFLAGVAGYVTWVYVALLSVNFLLHPPRSAPGRTGAAIALLVLFFTLFLLMVSCYVRVLQVIFTNPGYVPLSGNRRHRRQSSGRTRSNGAQDFGQAEKDELGRDKGYLDRTAVLDGRASPPPGLSDFYSRDVFECDIDGLPRWCSTCQVWKPDRSHHSSEVARCVYKMDHFCPWAGGIISETNFKFFIQFCLYTVFFCAFILITTAFFLAKGVEMPLKKATWTVMLALAVLFMLFSAGMSINTLHFAFLNTTTVDNLALGTRTQHFAVYSPNLASITGGYNNTPGFGTITYPLPATPCEPSARRTFAIVQTPVGTNAYRLPSMWANFRTVMGDHWYDWLLPVRSSPCCSHRKNGEKGGSMYVLGPVLERMIIT